MDRPEQDQHDTGHAKYDLARNVVASGRRDADSSLSQLLRSSHSGRGRREGLAECFRISQIVSSNVAPSKTEASASIMVRTIHDKGHFARPRNGNRTKLGAHAIDAEPCLSRQQTRYSILNRGVKGPDIQILSKSC